jgi:hypothetical protein
MLCTVIGTVTGPVILTLPMIAALALQLEAVRQLLDRGQLRGFKVGRCHWRITLAAVEAYERGERPQLTPKSPRRRPRVREPIDGPF